MKHSLVLEILEHLTTCGSSLMISALFTPYGHGLSRTVRDIERQADQCKHDFSKHSRNTTAVTFSRLKRLGLVNSRGPNKKVIWSITTKGRQHFQKTRAVTELPVKDGKIRLVVFDIPESMGNYRSWLRRRLLSCGYAPLQKSVWLGRRPLAEELYRELKERKLLSHVLVIGMGSI